ncbi:MAG: helix-turn-helix domain-containing protein [Candidatus Azobacteroides sp.]|nr:helix-turn-helix domain-containing protein [Candidatus Azobacteroides sp.]
MYQEHTPHILLKSWIETYWSTEASFHRKVRQNILPDGCVDIIFSFGDPLENQFSLRSPYLIGTMTAPLIIHYSGKINMLGIRFKPAAITVFTKVPVFEFTNSRIDLISVNTLFNPEFYEMLEEAERLEEKINRLDAYFITKLSDMYVPDERITHAVKCIRQQAGNVSVPELSREVCLCQRQFERRFKNAVGISPKSFSRITRFQEVYHKIKKKQTEETLSELAEKYGYYDHSHLIKEIRQYTGNSSYTIL